MRSQLESLLYENFIAPRQTYTSSDLGCPVILTYAKRVDFTLRNIEGSYKCSYYKPKVPTNMCVVYLHSMGGSRIESSTHAKRFVEKGVGFAALDFCGSGMSDGNHNSLGPHSRLEAIGLIEHLIKEFKVEKVIIWGRSMGAAIAIKVMQYYFDLHKSEEVLNKKQTRPQATQNPVIGLILDSPFYSLTKLIVEIAEQKMVVVPKVFIKAVIGLMRNTIESVTQCNLDDYDLLPILPKLTVPIIILASKQDSTINYQHSETLYVHYPTKNKELAFIPGSHSEVRDYETVTKLVEFSLKVFKDGNGKSYSKQKEGFKEKQGRGICFQNQMFDKKTSPQKTQTETSTVDIINQFPPSRQKHVSTNFKPSHHKRAETQRSSMFVRNRISPGIRQPLNEQYREGNKISVQSIPVKRKPTLMEPFKGVDDWVDGRVDGRVMKKIESSSIHDSQGFKKKPPTDRVIYESHQKYEVRRFLC